MTKSTSSSNYTTNVFINCPFDDDYKPILNAIAFAVIDCGFTVRCALAAEDNSPTRIDKIYKLIDECRFGIHDLSRIQHDTTNGLPRFNMPFELGLFLAARHFGGAKHRIKSCLVLAVAQYEYQKFLSDIAGQDVSHHADKPKLSVQAVRNWLSEARPSGARALPGATAIMEHLYQFQEGLPAMLKTLELAPQELNFFDQANLMGAFVRQRSAHLRKPEPTG